MMPEFNCLSRACTKPRARRVASNDVLALDLRLGRALDMASNSGAGGSRRGAGRKRKFDVARGRRKWL